ncbi:MAG: exonuclease domain-containing protein [Lachnospiraceae bacterium]|nr:exonuclease domain-containing protein [Lachnospiraceae bacterium]
MNYVVLDLEWNQPDKNELVNPDLPFEIVEMGAILLNENRQIIGEFTQIVKPVVYKEMNRITGKLIHLNTKELNYGKSFTDTMKDFFEWCGEEYIFCTWGTQDLTELQRNMKYHEMPPLALRPFPYLDVQKLFSIAFDKDRKVRRSLEYAVEYLQIEQDIPFHRAFSDAYYTAKVMEAMEEVSIFENYSYDVFHVPKSRKDEVKVLFHDYAKYISKEFEDKTEAMQDREVISTKCYLCKKNLRKKIRWFAANPKHFYSVSVCDKHGFMKGKIRLKKSEDGVYVVKTQKFISEEEVDEIVAKREHIRQMRREKRKAGKQES